MGYVIRHKFTGKFYHDVAGRLVWDDGPSHVTIWTPSVDHAVQWPTREEAEQHIRRSKKSSVSSLSAKTT